MPYSIRKVGKNKYQVYNTATGEIHSKGTTKKKAEGQFRLLQREIVGDLEGGDLHGNLLKMQQGLHLAGEPFRVLGLPNPYDLGDGIGQALGETIRGGGSGNVTGRRNTDMDIRQAIARYEGIPTEYDYGDFHRILDYEYRIGTIYNDLRDRYEYGRLLHMNPQQLARAIYNTMGGTPETSIHDLELEQSMEEDERTKMGMEDRDAVGRGRRMRGGMLTNQSQEPVKFQLEQFRKHTTFKKPNGTLQLKPPNQIAGKPQTLHRVNLVKGHLNDALRTSNEGYTAERIQYLMDNPNEPITAIDADEQEMLDALVGMGRRGGVLEPSEPYVEGETDTEMSDDEAEVGDVADDPLGQPHVWNGQEWVPVAPQAQMEEPDFDNEVFEGQGRRMRGGGLPQQVQSALRALRQELRVAKTLPKSQQRTQMIHQIEDQIKRINERAKETISAPQQYDDDEMEGDGRRMRGKGTCGIRRMNAVAPEPEAVNVNTEYDLPPQVQVTESNFPTGDMYVSQATETVQNLNQLVNEIRTIDRTLTSSPVLPRETVTRLRHIRQELQQRYDTILQEYRLLTQRPVYAHPVTFGFVVPEEVTAVPARSQIRPATVAPAPTQTGREYQPRRFL